MGFAKLLEALELCEAPGGFGKPLKALGIHKAPPRVALQRALESLGVL